MIKSPFLFNYISESLEFREVKKQYELVAQHRPATNSLFSVDEEGTCTVYNKNNNSLEDCVFSGRIVSGLYRATKDSDRSASFLYGSVHTALPFTNNGEMNILVQGTNQKHEELLFSQYDRRQEILQRRRNNNQMVANRTSDYSRQETQEQESQTTSTRTNNTQTTNTSSQKRERVPHAPITTCTHNYFVNPRESLEDVVGGCVGFDDTSRICSVQTTNGHDLFYIQPSGRVYRDRGSDGILGWVGSARRVEDDGSIVSDDLLDNSFQRFSARDNHNNQREYAGRVSKINSFAKKYFGASCQRPRQESQTTHTRGQHNNSVPSTNNSQSNTRNSSSDVVRAEYTNCFSNSLFDKEDAFVSSSCHHFGEEQICGLRAFDEPNQYFFFDGETLYRDSSSDGFLDTSVAIRISEPDNLVNKLQNISSVSWDDFDYKTNSSYQQSFSKSVQAISQKKQSETNNSCLSQNNFQEISNDSATDDNRILDVSRSAIRPNPYRRLQRDCPYIVEHENNTYCVNKP